ncbi:hypothetical protein [Streptomyces caniscabiei]|uniref:Uncharacterized protein n=1 Tax=Streptomyces caniscabiei TaxID=2746961 RepID=A0A927L7C1_9ACTN|nr:hypothetical protein [Streptomyces caniscabiei]MBD9727441.1 hypothetical protein [Streptomyces caniscabiei]MDX3512671.1 hypothetical protein [Streptomyces caniscabiei]MDX3722196.1 hypothetical protein [Streptomyces caniscabiei]MDX3730730.1 hypothetical protein [Streptomyces caniscabiei]WEO28823.1 hypothetical protein IHE65_39765 [Streptomyces caniscabiei]
MRWLTLYARSRQVPASLAAMVIGAAAVWAPAARDGGGPADPKMPVFVLVAGVTAASIGLGGQDLALDRTAAIGWRPRRAAHVLLIGAVVGAVLLAVATTTDTDLATTAFVVRDSAGLAGLVALGAVVCGGAYAWTPVVLWLSFSVFAPAPTSLPMEVATWMLLPPGTPAATWTALALAVTGTTLYAFAGPRR